MKASAHHIDVVDIERPPGSSICMIWMLYLNASYCNQSLCLISNIIYAVLIEPRREWLYCVHFVSALGPRQANVRSDLIRSARFLRRSGARVEHCVQAGPLDHMRCGGKVWYDEESKSPGLDACVLVDRPCSRYGRERVHSDSKVFFGWSTWHLESKCIGSVASGRAAIHHPPRSYSREGAVPSRLGCLWRNSLAFKKSSSIPTKRLREFRMKPWRTTSDVVDIGRPPGSTICKSLNVIIRMF